MTEETVTYWAISVLSSNTFRLNAVALVVEILELADVVVLVTPTWKPLYTAGLAVLNMYLRTRTVRPVAFIAPGTTKAIEVPRIAAPPPPVAVGD
jgi:hypothetical protein